MLVERRSCRQSALSHSPQPTGSNRGSEDYSQARHVQLWADRWAAAHSRESGPLRPIVSRECRHPVSNFPL